MKPLVQKYRVQKCGCCKQFTEQLLIDNQWICLACACKFDWIKKQFIPCTADEFTILENEGYVEITLSRK